MKQPRILLDDNLIEAYFDKNKAKSEYPQILDYIYESTIDELVKDAYADDKKQLLKNLLAEACSFGLSAYCSIYCDCDISVDISIGDLDTDNVPGRLTLMIKSDHVSIESLAINKFVIYKGEVRDDYRECSRSCLAKFGWTKHYNCYNFRSPKNLFAFGLRWLPHWLKKLSKIDCQIAEMKTQIAKSSKIAEIQADRLQGILESVIVSIEEKLPELKCKLRRSPEQKLFSLWLYNFAIEKKYSSDLDDKRYMIFKPAKEYVCDAPDIPICGNVTRQDLDKMSLKPVRMFTIEKCVTPTVASQRKLEYDFLFVYVEESSEWQCTSATVLPDFMPCAYLQFDKIESWILSLIDAEIKGYTILKNNKNKMKAFGTETYSEHHN